MIRTVVMRSSLALLTLAGLGACTRRVDVTPSSMVGPTLILEQFLTAANAQDLTKMGTLFGTADKGSVTGQWPKDEVEKRMFIFANVLKHDDYTIEGEQLVPGRLNEAKQLNVALRQGQRRVTVPFTLVRTKNDAWLVEQFDMQKITGSR